MAMDSTNLIRFASFSLLFIAATRAEARASAEAEVSHTKFDLRGSFPQSGYLTPLLTGATRAPRETASTESNTMAFVCVCFGEVQRLKVQDNNHVHLEGAEGSFIVESYSKKSTFRISGVDWFPRSCLSSVVMKTGNITLNLSRPSGEPATV